MTSVHRSLTLWALVSVLATELPYAGLPPYFWQVPLHFTCGSLIVYYTSNLVVEQNIEKCFNFCHRALQYQVANAPSR